MLEQTDEDRRISLQMIEAAKARSKSHYDSHVHPHTFSEGDLVLFYDQAHDKTRKGKFKSIWYGPYVIHICLEKGAYLIFYSNDLLLKNPCNGIYLKKLYS